MRRRRAQRCLQNAANAIEIGLVDAARAALDEARQLSAPADEVARIDALIEARVAASQRRAGRPRRYAFAALAALAILAVVATFAATTFFRSKRLLPTAGVNATATDSGRTPASVKLAVEDVRAPAVTGSAIGPPAPDEAAPSLGTGGVGELTAAPTTAIDNPVAAETPQVPLARIEDTAAASLAGTPPEPPVAAVNQTGVAIEPPSLSVASATDPLPVPSVPELEAKAPVVTPAPPTVRPEPRQSPVRDESAAVREALARYERAYNELNPSLASAVYPGVDERALSRAFDNLASQQVVLSRCDVSTDGPAARAVCSGSATWTPKVGGGRPRTQARHWTFDLSKAGEFWQIDRAIVR